MILRLHQQSPACRALCLNVLIALFAAAAEAQSGQVSTRGLTVSQSTTEPRVALVIGNARYAQSPLKNPVNDARDMAAALKEIGFKVTLVENQDQIGMKRALQAFGARLNPGTVGLFYYAGHGVQAFGKNWLIPVNASITRESDLKVWAVDVEEVIGQMEESRSPVNIVILDACRDNPLTRSMRSASRGLGTVNAPRGTLIAYATAPGQTAADGTHRNGIYTQHLLQNLRKPGLPIEEVFKRTRIAVSQVTSGAQLPWESSSLVGDFFFQAPRIESIRPSAPAATASPANPSATTGPSRGGPPIAPAELAPLRSALLGAHLRLARGEYRSAAVLLEVSMAKLRALKSERVVTQEASALETELNQAAAQVRKSCQAELAVARRRGVAPPVCPS